jgi:hypothetical protein
MLVGAAFLAILTGAIAQRFVGRWQRGEDADAPGQRKDEDAVLAKLDELGERIARIERAVTRSGG